jgi:hypothetical protein
MFWGNSPCSTSIFITPKGIVGIIMKIKPKASCKKMFSTFAILTLYTQHIFSILMFVIKHMNLFALNMEFHSINTCHKLDLSKVQKGVYYSGIKLFNSLPLSIKQDAHDLNKFKHKLKTFLMLNPFHSVEEYLDRDNISEVGVSQ